MGVGAGQSLLVCLLFLSMSYKSGRVRDTRRPLFRALRDRVLGRIVSHRMSSRAGLVGRLCLGVSTLDRRSVHGLVWRGWRVWDTPPGLFRLGGGILRRCIVERSWPARPGLPAVDLVDMPGHVHVCLWIKYPVPAIPEYPFAPGSVVDLHEPPVSGAVPVWFGYCAGR